MKLLTVGDAKTVKGQKKGFLTGILYLAPADESGVLNVCPFSSTGCRAACLYTAGRSQVFPMINLARIEKTKWLKRDHVSFYIQIAKDITALVARAERENLIPCVRLNGTSDLPKMPHYFCERFPAVQFYDYTKIPRPWERARKNYHLTFSLSEDNHKHAMAALHHGINVAVVFDSKRIPPMWEGFKVVNGYESDLRFLDKKRTAVVIGLYAKGRAKKDTSGFVQLSLPA